MLEGVKRTCEAEQVVFEQSPVGESQSNGMVENTVKRVQGMYRTYKADMETRYKHKIGTNHPITGWAIKPSALNITRCTKGTDGMTAYRRLKG